MSFNRNFFFPLTFIILTYSCFTQESTAIDNTWKAQDINPQTCMCNNRHFCAYVESDIGYRHDNISNLLELYDDLWDITGGRRQQINLTQLNFRGGAVIYDYVFIKGAIGYGFVNSDKEKEASYIKGSNYLVNSYYKEFNSGHAFDGLVGGGARIPLYKKYLAMDAEIGYDYKKIFITNSLKTRISSPYVGVTFYGSLGYHFQLALYGSYFVSPAAQESGYLYFVKTNSFAPAPSFRTHHHVTAYKTGANLSYLISDHVSVLFNWERFSSKTGAVNGAFDIPIMNTTVTGLFSAKLNHWISNQYVLGLRFTF